MKRFIIIFFLFLIKKSIAQTDVGNIILDRPDLTESPYLVPENYFQAECGLLMENGRNKNRQLTLPTVL